MEKNLCYRCKRNEAGKKGEDISLAHRGMQINIFRFGGLCIECAKTEWLKNFNDNAERFIEIVNGKPTVNWKRYCEDLAMGRFYDKKERFHFLLVGLGILSRESKGNWEIAADGPIGLNPRAYGAYLYFTRKEDAVEFARLEKAGALYGWEIHHIDEVISKQDVVKS